MIFLPVGRLRNDGLEASGDGENEERRCRTYDRERPQAAGGDHPERGRDPKGGRRGQALDRLATVANVVEDVTGAKESDAGRDTLDDPARIPRAGLDWNGNHGGGAEAHEHVRAQPGRSSAQLSFPA